MQTRLDSFAKCEEQSWPDSGGPSSTFIPPHAVSGKTTQTYSFQGLGLNSDQLLTSNKASSVTDGKVSAKGKVLEASGKIPGNAQGGGGVPHPPRPDSFLVPKHAAARGRVGWGPWGYPCFGQGWAQILNKASAWLSLQPPTAKLFVACY